MIMKNNTKLNRCSLSLLLGILAMVGAYFCGEANFWPGFAYLVVLANIFIVSGLIEGHYLRISRRIEQIEGLITKDKQLPEKNDVDGREKSSSLSAVITKWVYILFAFLFLVLIYRIITTVYKLH